MLSSKEGFSFHEGLDMDAISDITGISFSKIDNEEKGSDHSGSVASDNTELLLNQNFSLQDLDVHVDGEDSFLDSVSQVGEYEEHTSDHQTLFSSSPNRYYPSQKNAVADSDSLQRGMPNEFLSRPITHDPHSFQEIRTKKTIALEQESITSGQSTSFVNYKQEFSPKGSNKDKLSPPRYLTRKYPSDTNIDGCGRHSVIKHHSRISSIKPEITPVLYGQNVHDLYSSEQKLANGKDHCRAQQVCFYPEPFENRNFTKNEQESVSKQNDNRVHSHEKMPMFDEEGGANFSSHDRHLDYQERHRSQPKMGPVGNDLNDIYHGGPLEDLKPARNGNQEMLLGVKHDPDTNELYDDKVREGANLLSRIFGGDHNGSFNSLSSTSRGSEKSQDENNTKLSSVHENRPQTTQRSMDSSLNSEAKYKSASPPRKYAPAPSKQLFQTSSNQNVNQSDHKPATTPQRASQTVKESAVHSSAKEHLWNQEQVEFNNALGSHNKAIALKNNKESQEYSNVPKYVKNEYSEGREDCFKRPIDPVVNKRNTLNYNIEVIGDEEIFQDKIEEFKRLELDMEEIYSRKKITMHELKALEEALKRNKADMKSSDNLVEQYRWQATQTRSELMELEKTRNQLQEECNALNEVLEKSKQKKGFNSSEIMFGRSKEEIFTSLQERDKFRKDVELMNEQLKREKERAKIAQDDLGEKITILEDDLKKQHRNTVENLKKMNEERSANVEVLEEKFKKEANHLKKTAENAESRIKQLEASLAERNEEITKLRRQHREEKQKTLDIEKRWRSQVESERQDAELRLDEQERSCKDRENKLLHQQTELENLVEERSAELRRSDERCRTQTEELQKIIENKNEEIKLVRGLVRQQEDSTRVLGERLRTEAREHVRNAVEKERQSLNKEKERIGKSVEEEKEKNARAVRKFTEQLEMEKESHLQTKQTINKLKQEAEELRRKVIDVHGERISGAQRVRQEGSEELEKIKEKLHEFTHQAEKLEKVDRETAKAIYEECRKVAELVDMPMSFKRPTRLPDGKSDEKVDGVQESPTKEALASLRHCNNELQQRLSDMRKQMEKQRTQVQNIKKKAVSNGSDEELSNLQKVLGEKEEEIQRLHKEYGDVIVNLQTEKKKDQLTYKRTVAKLEQEFQKIVTANLNISGSVRMDKRDIPRNAASISSGVGPKLLHNVSPQFPSRLAGKTSGTDLLKHLQDRVKKLRAENENLKKSSTIGTSFDSIKQPRKVKWLDNSDSVLSQSKRLTISQLGSPAKSLEMKSHPNSDVMNGNIDQIARLKKLLASTTKDDLTLPQTNTG